MTERATLEALLARVLEGTGPDRELDAEIHAATLHIKPITPEAVVTRECQENGFYALHQVPGSSGGVSYWHQAPPYTASLDAVLRDLLPIGYDWVRRTPGTMALVCRNDWFSIAAQDHQEPARALIAACLKARMEVQGD